MLFVFWLNFIQKINTFYSIKTKAKEGSIIVAKHIRKIVEAKVGKAVSDDYLWDLFNRHNWKKKMPRPEHPKCNKQA